MDLLIQDLNRRLSERQLTLRLSDQAKAYVADQGYDPVYGARPLKRFIQRKVETMLAQYLIAHGAAPGSVLEVDLMGN